MCVKRILSLIPAPVADTQEIAEKELDSVCAGCKLNSALSVVVPFLTAALAIRVFVALNTTAGVRNDPTLPSVLHASVRGEEAFIRTKTVTSTTGPTSTLKQCERMW